MKAFLSHSWSDAEFVRAVGDELGRQFTWLDVHAFETGDEFIAGMEEGVRDSSVFVLFASRKALQSINVGYEIAEAKRALISKVLDRTMVFIIDPGVSHRDLPTWLQRANVALANAPKVTARAIRTALDETARNRQRSLFIGRSRERRQIEEKLFPADGATPPRVLVLSGLPGIGRRSLLERVATDHWNLRPRVQIAVESGDQLADVAVKFADRFEPYNGVAAFRDIAQRIHRETTDQLRVRTAEYLTIAVENHELPVLIDEGGMLTNDGAPTEVASLILQIIAASPKLYAAMITRRRPHFGVGIPSVFIPDLPLLEAKQLVSALVGRSQLELSPDSITRLAESADGYPPSIYHSVELVRDYGLDVTLRDENRLTASRTIPLIQYLRAVALSAVEKQVVRFLAAISPLPLSVIGEILHAPPHEIAPVIGRLIDAALVIPDELGYYRLARPMRVVVLRELQDLDKNEYALVADALEAELQNEEHDDVPRLEVARTLYRAHVLADDDTHRESAFSLSSDLISAAQTLYHRRDYRRAVEFARAALQDRPNNYDARYTLARALIKTGDYDVAEREIEILRQRNFLRESAFLLGFLHRHRGRTQAAIEQFETALERGYRGLAIHRELAQCYLAINDLPNAREHANEAARRGADNRFLIDLQVQIAVLERNERVAIEKLRMLETIDQPEFYFHRASTVYSAFGQQQAALDSARRAVDATVRPTFAMLSQLAVSEINVGSLDEAATQLRRLERDFPNHHRDIRIGLSCKLEIARRHYDDALVLWNQLRDKEKPVHVALRRNALAGLLHGALPDAIRSEYRREVEELSARLEGNGSIDFEFLNDDV
jgi:tetratricopeptide (TPR) repeat protein